MLAGLAVILGTIAIGLVFSRTITLPMRELIERAARIGRGDREAFRPLRHYGTREFAQLSHSFLGMAEQLALRRDYIATFSAHLTHELKSPLTSIKGAAELLQDSIQGKSEGLTPADGTGMGLAIARGDGEPWRLNQAQADRRGGGLRASVSRGLDGEHPGGDDGSDGDETSNGPAGGIFQFRMTGRPHDLCRIGGMLLCHDSLARFFPRHM